MFKTTTRAVFDGTVEERGMMGTLIFNSTADSNQSDVNKNYGFFRLTLLIDIIIIGFLSVKESNFLSFILFIYILGTGKHGADANAVECL